MQIIHILVFPLISLEIADDKNLVGLALFFILFFSVLFFFLLSFLYSFLVIFFPCLL